MKYFNYLILFTINFIIMGLELVGIRILSPFNGTSTLVWTSMLSTILCSLTAGYFLGGYFSKIGRSKPQIVIGALLFTSYLLFGCMALVKDYILHFFMTIELDNAIKAAISSIILFFPSVALMSAVPVLISKLEVEKSTAKGKVLARIFGISSIGGIFGLWVTSFILIPHIGSNKILFFFCGIGLVITSVFVLGRWMKIVSMVIALYTLYQSFNPLHLHYVDVDSLYNRIFIYTEKTEEGKDVKYLQLNNHINAGIQLDQPFEPFFDYNKKILEIIEAKEEKAEILVLGGAAFSLSSAVGNLPVVKRIDIVEIDGALPKLAREHFSSIGPTVNIIVEDARTYLQENKRVKYDIIVWDVFTSVNNIPDHLTTLETAVLLKENLKESGVVLMNIISPLKGKGSRFLYSEIKTFQQTFQSIEIIPVHSNTDMELVQNILLEISNSRDEGMKNHVAVPHSAIIITDDYCPFSFL